MIRRVHSRVSIAHADAFNARQGALPPSLPPFLLSHPRSRLARLLLPQRMLQSSLRRLTRARYAASLAFIVGARPARVEPARFVLSARYRTRARSAAAPPPLRVALASAEPETPPPLSLSSAPRTRARHFLSASRATVLTRFRQSNTRDVHRCRTRCSDALSLPLSPSSLSSVQRTLMRPGRPLERRAARPARIVHRTAHSTRHTHRAQPAQPAKRAGCSLRPCLGGAYQRGRRCAPGDARWIRGGCAARVSGDDAEEAGRDLGGVWAAARGRRRTGPQRRARVPAPASAPHI
ncbi:hypothetical protein HYPSUDRAFT_470597 [Hypholoma sublateritium FD-334 SS-4]|uniref:Uncharacterized protein n=1 Tax=Hypholoma sublateritium (strain FD-334 SS-4) TaxID=945553 RepID=A0A0D2N3T7_HYPSF|nr:hypothetical protein HYPSUDRAFT_470597 [Hypholoma sublateritium FD-334 SS-4]